jgi:hypothetical protein
MRFFRLQNLALALILVAFAGFVAQFTAPVAHAQADLGSISGVITDASGAVVPKASITVVNVATGATHAVETNSRGEFNITQLVPSDYSVTVKAPGFAPATQSVSVTVGSQNTFNARLAVSGGKTEITVAADNFAGVQLEKPEISAVIETDQILSLPTPDRDPYSLVAYSGNLSSDPTGGNRGVGFNISGARSASVDILLDGVENTDLYAVGIGQSVPLDATAEIRIVTSNSGAEYGRGSGAVNVSTKSGTNQFHGSAYEYNRISTLGSDGYNNNYLHDFYGSQAKPRYTHNQFGYSVGGPVKKDKIFFFSSTEWTRIRSAANVVAVIPTDALIGQASANMQSYFSTYGKVDHAINGQKFKGSDVQNLGLWVNDINNIGLAQMGLPAGTTLTNNCADPQIATSAICSDTIFGQSIYQVPADSGGGTPVNQWITFNRGDITFNQTTSMFARYIQQSTVNPAGSVNSSPYDGYNTPQTQYNHSLEISLSKAFTNSLASATKLLGSRLNNAQPLAGAPVSPTLYVNGSSAVALGGSDINFPGYSQTSPGNALPFGGPQNFIEIGEDIAWTKGKHQFTFGGAFLYIKDNRTFGAYEEAVDALVQSGSNKALQNFINGNLQEVEFAINPQGAFPCYQDGTDGGYVQTSACTIQLPATSPNFSRSNRYDDGSLYANDSYKVSPKLTLNLGLRWEIYGPQHSQKASNDANFFPDYTQKDVWDSIRNGHVMTRANAPNGRLWNLNKKQFAPKVGFAYDPFGNGKTSIRGGYGISYERNFNNVTFNVIQNPPNYAVVAFVNKANPYPINNENLGVFATGTGSKLLPNVTLRAVDPHIKPSYASDWSLSIERQVGTTTASVSYVGTRGIHNYSIANVNRIFDGSNYLGDAYTPNRTNYEYSNINWRGADGDSYYHGLTAELRSANLLRTGLTVRADYTWSHSLDNTSSTFTDGGSNNDNLGYLDPWNKRLDHGSSDFDQRQRAAIAMFWVVPFGKNRSGAAKLIADGWTASTTFTAQTGNPFSVFDCYDAYTVCPRASFVSPQPKKHTSNLVDISTTFGANTYSYLTLPPFYDANGNELLTNYNEQVNPNTGTSDTPICSGLYGVGCQFVPGMTGRNQDVGPGSWNQNLAILKDFKFHDRYDVQLKGEFINVYNHANTYLNLGGTNDVSYVTDILAYKSGNRNTQLSLHFSF